MGCPKLAGEPSSRDIAAGGYGYADYAGPGYGISAITRERMSELAASAGGWKEVLFLERGWDQHHDVYALTVEQ